MIYIKNRYRLMPDYPSHLHTAWTGSDFQGVAHDDNNWFFTTRYFLWKFPVGFDLNTEFSLDSQPLPPGVILTGIPGDVGQHGYYNHFNDFDHYKGFLLVPITTFDKANPPKPLLAVFRADNFEYCGAALLKQAWDHTWAAWCAMNPTDGLLYTSGDGTSTTKPIQRYGLRLSAAGIPELTAASPFPIYDEMGRELALEGGATWMQGGAFSPDGLLYLVCSADDESVIHGGIHVFDRDGLRIAKSRNGAEPFNFQFQPHWYQGQEEPEGITIWDLPAGKAPHINGQVHVFLYGNVAANVSFKHYYVDQESVDIPSKAQPIDQTMLVLKATHNSYANLDIGGQNDPPWVSHPPSQQVDGFGVWGLEIDFGLVEQDGSWRPKVGHNAPGEPTSWGNRDDWSDPRNDLEVWLKALRDCATFRSGLRPLILGIEKKGHPESEGQHDWPYPPPVTVAFPILEAVVRSVFPDDAIFGPEALHRYRSEHGEHAPTLPELGGQVVIYTYGEPEWNSYRSSLFFTDVQSWDVIVLWSGIPDFHFTTRQEMEAHIAETLSGAHGLILLRHDQYQADWTFESGVPPNPIHVDANAPASQVVTDSEGDVWADDGETWRGQVIHEQGTVRFPFKRIRSAVTRAEGTTPNGVRDQFRAGYGWTVMIRPGNYPERLRVDIPLTLRKDPQRDGTVIIGR